MDVDLNEFDIFYNDKLAAAIDKLKPEYDAADVWKYAAVFSFIVFMASGILAMIFHFDGCGPIIVIAVITGIVSLVKYTKKNDIYTDDYKSTLITEIMQHLCPGMTYVPGDCVAEQEYDASSLFRWYNDNYYGSNYMEGIHAKVPFHCSELKTVYENNAVIFKGLFFVAQLNSAFTSGTYVWSNNFIQLPTTMMDEKYRMVPMPDVNPFAIDNASFNDDFSVYTTSAAESSYILTEERIQQIVNFKRKYKTDVALSFVAGKCYVAMAAAEDLLDPTGIEPSDKDVLIKYYFTITTILDIIDRLQLNELI